MYTGLTPLEQCSLLGGEENKGTAPDQAYEPEMRRVQEYVEDSALCPSDLGVEVDSGPTVGLPRFIFVSVPKVHDLEPVTPSTTLDNPDSTELTSLIVSKQR